MNLYISRGLRINTAFDYAKEEQTIDYLVMEKNLKQIVTVAEAVKKKFKKMRNVESEYDKALENVFKPVISPLNQLTDAMRQTETKEVLTPFKKEEKKFDNDDEPIDWDEEDETTKKRYSDNFMTPTLSTIGSEENISDKECDIESNSSGKSAASTIDYSSRSLTSEYLKDTPFGIRHDGEKLMMGSAIVTITHNNIRVGRRQYNKTPGLIELLSKGSPNLKVITKEDIGNYKLMLLESNVHRRDYDPSKPIKSNKGIKYLNIIKPLFNKNDCGQSSEVQGSGLPILKKWKKNVDYVYWDDPNELVDRLKLLIASRDAGNTGLDNEIISIIEELKESGLIDYNK